MTNRHALILAGGRGTRFWPRSRTQSPKQLLPFLTDRTLLQSTVDLLSKLVGEDRVWILTNELLRPVILRQLPGVPKRQVIAEPAQRNTAPCIGLASQIVKQVDPDAVMGIFPADHLIAKPSRFLRLVRAAYKEAARGHITVIGIQPRWPETGYGYIEFPKSVEPGSLAALDVKKFREKPELAQAKRFLKSGNFYWNAGMFFWCPDVLLESMRKHLPKTSSLLASLPAFGTRKFTTSLREVYPKTEDISIDYAVMEKASGVRGLASGDIGWSDLGSWNAVYELLVKDREENAVRGDVLLIDSRGNLVESGKPVALVGVEDLVVVDTPHALLVTRRDRAQDVGQAVKRLEKLGRHELL